MDAVDAVALQAVAASVVVVVGTLFLIIATPLGAFLRHPLINFELVVAMGLSRLPRPTSKPYRTRYKGRHRK